MNIVKYAVMNALATTAYIALLALGFFYAPRIFTVEPSPIIPVVMLLLFVLSAAVTGSLVLGRPILWYLDGRKAEAFRLFVYTLGSLLCILIVAVVFAWAL